MTARIQCAGTPKRCEASAINEAHELDVAVALFCVAFPAIATSEQDRSPSPAMTNRDAIIPTRGKLAAVNRSFQREVLGLPSEGPPKTINAPAKRFDLARSTGMEPLAIEQRNG